MLNQSNALRKLELTLSEAVDTKNEEQTCGRVLLEVLNLDIEPQNMVVFYEILSKAKEEAINIKNIDRLDRYIKPLEDLQHIFIAHHAWATTWNVFFDHIIKTNVLVSLDALANYFHQQNPTIFLESEFLEKLNSEFQSLLNQVTNSELSKDLKNFLIKHIEDILRAIRRSNLDGTEGLERATKSFVTDLVMIEHNLKDEDKKDPKYLQVRSWIVALLIWITPTPYDIIGAVPDLQVFWVSKFEQLALDAKNVENTCKTSTIEEILKSSEFSKQSQKSLPGRETKLLPPSKENIEITTHE